MQNDSGSADDAAQFSVAVFPSQPSRPVAAYLPVPDAPAVHGWNTLESYLISVRLDAEWSVAPDFETLGRLVALRSDLNSDIEYLEGLRQKLDDLLERLAASKRDANHQQ